MSRIPTSDLTMRAAYELVGRVIESQSQAGVTYALERLVGSGGMGSAYLAKRSGPEGASAVVVKLVNHELFGGTVAPELVALKEAVALGRLNDVVPPTPYVVRLVDSGSALISGPISTPWTAIEYVHGGAEGTTLEERVTYSVHRTSYAFDRNRAAHAVRCLADGLSAIHGVGVIHRDLSPSNVLCCGFGQTEQFKISDFGIARASNIPQTFHGVMLGTLGYSAPEATVGDADRQSDVFSLATVVYYLLTGQHYFDADSPREVMKKVRAKSRPSITDHASLSPDLLGHTQACEEIDRALARATSLMAGERPQTAAELAASLLPWFGDTHAGPRSSQRLLQTLHVAKRELPAGELEWLIKSRGSDARVIRSAAWDPSGHAFVLSTSGAAYWNGSEFLDARGLVSSLPFEPTFVQHHDPGGWLLSGHGPTLWVIDTDGTRETINAPRPELQFEQVSGRLNDLLVAVATSSSEPTQLLALCGHRWIKACPLPEGASVSTLQCLDDTRWLVGGRLQDQAFAAIYSPLQVSVTLLPLPTLRAMSGGASLAERASALLVGSGGFGLWFSGETPAPFQIPGAPDLSAAALDVFDRQWVASAEVLWSREAGDGKPWKAMWRAPGWRAPFVSMMADVGMVTAMTADGAIVEGRVSSDPRQPT